MLPSAKWQPKRCRSVPSVIISQPRARILHAPATQTMSEFGVPGGEIGSRLIRSRPDLADSLLLYDGNIQRDSDTSLLGRPVRESAVILERGILMSTMLRVRQRDPAKRIVLPRTRPFAAKVDTWLGCRSLRCSFSLSSRLFGT